jgi:tape measure domain-containing protein
VVDVAELVIRTDTRQVVIGERQLRDLAQQARRTEQATDRFGRSTEQLGRRMESVNRTFVAARGALTAVAGSMVARELISYADAWTLLQGRLRLVTGSAAELSDITDQLTFVANESGVALEATADLYTRLARATEETGLSQRELIATTEALTRATVISGASAQEAENALRQLAQGMASGTLRGEELNSVMEQMPIVAQAIAREMGVTIGELRELAAEGQVTTDVVISAVQNVGDTWAAEFQQMPRTVAQALAALDNEFGRLIGLTSDASGGASGLAGAIDMLAGAMRDLNDVGLPDWLDPATHLLEGTRRELESIVAAMRAVGLADFTGPLEQLNNMLRAAEGLDVALEDTARRSAAMVFPQPGAGAQEPPVVEITPGPESFQRGADPAVQARTAGAGRGGGRAGARRVLSLHADHRSGVRRRAADP